LAQLYTEKTGGNPVFSFLLLLRNPVPEKRWGRDEVAQGSTRSGIVDLGLARIRAKGATNTDNVWTSVGEAKAMSIATQTAMSNSLASGT